MDLLHLIRIVAFLLAPALGLACSAIMDTPPHLCGNGAVDGEEPCDGDALGGQSCADLGFHGGTLACNPDCTYDVTGCLLAGSCGDGVVQTGFQEQCDENDLNGLTCEVLGYYDGVLACNPDCTYDVTGCLLAGSCGDGVVQDDFHEQCDGNDLNSETCATLGFVGGVLACDDMCHFLTTGCTSCGNGVINAGEQCDGTALGGQTCVTKGFVGGTLACNASCSGFVTTGCAQCGNNTINSPEVCDGDALGGRTCVTLGYDGGTLACVTMCTDFDTSGCWRCGDGVLQPENGETCDDGGTLPWDGCDPTCTVEPSFHLPVRLAGGGGSNEGRLEIFLDGSWRRVRGDVTALWQDGLAEVVCRQLGFTGAEHRFIADATVEFGAGTGAFAMSGLECTGLESTLVHCRFPGWYQAAPSAPEVPAGLECAPGEGDLRLTSHFDHPSVDGRIGRVQIFHEDAWGEVCRPEWEGSYHAVTACRQLGYRDGEPVDGALYPAPTDDFLLDGVVCQGAEQRLIDCDHDEWGIEDCSAWEAFALRCAHHQEGDARLVGGDLGNEGRLEVLHHGVWGQVCDDSLSTPGPAQARFVSVSCLQLAFSGMGTLMGTAATTLDAPFLHDVACGGLEERLLDCFWSGWSGACPTGQVVTLTCTP